MVRVAGREGQMDARSRILAALASEPVDRIPLLPMFDDGYWARAGGCEHWESAWENLGKQVSVQVATHRRHSPADGLRAWAGMYWGPFENCKVVASEGQHYLVHMGTGERDGVDITPDNLSRGSKAATTQRETEEIAVDSIDDVQSKTLGAPAVEKPLSTPTSAALARLVKELGETVFVSCNNGCLCPTALIHLGGFEKGLVAVAERPVLVQAVLERITPRFIPHIRAAATRGADAIRIGCFQGGANVLSPATWRRLVKPYHAKLVEAAHAAGIKHVFWSLGDCLSLARGLAKIGTDLVVTEQPRTGYRTKPGLLRQAAGYALSIAGWQCERDLLAGDVAALRRSIRQQFEETGRHGHCLMSAPVLTWEYQPEVMEGFSQECAHVSRELLGQSGGIDHG